MSEGVYRILQLGAQSGTALAPGSAVDATVLYPCEPGGPPTIDRGSAIPNEDVGRNVRNRPGRGYHGMRLAEMPFESDVRFEDAMRLFEMFFAGGVTPSGSSPYTWVYPLEGGVPTLKPYTVEEGVPSSTQDEWEISSVLLRELTLGFDALAAPGASPWRATGTFVGFTRAVATLTAALSAPATLETAMGHLTRGYEGTTGTAYASLSEIASSLIAYEFSGNRQLVPRAYGSASDVPTAWGFSEKTEASFTAMWKIASATKTAFYDTYENGLGSMTDRRWRITATGSNTLAGSANKKMHIDGRVSITAVNVGDRDGERTYDVAGEYVDDTTLSAPCAVTLINGVASLT